MSLEQLFDNIKKSFEDKKENDNDPILQQGKQYLSFQEKEKTGLCKHLKLLECTNSCSVRGFRSCACFFIRNSAMPYLPM